MKSEQTGYKIDGVVECKNHLYKNFFQGSQ